MPIHAKQKHFNRNFARDWKQAAGNVVSHPGFFISAVTITFIAAAIVPVGIKVKREAAKEAHRSHEIDGVNYMLTDAHLVSTTEDDGDVHYNINYRTGIVEYNKYGGGEKSSIYLFQDFANASDVDESFLEEARQAGLLVADRIIEEYEALDEGKRQKWNKDDDRADKLEDARIFKQRYSDENAIKQVLSHQKSDESLTENQMPKLKPL